MARRTGRRPGNQDTREAILASAREIFAERGYDATSIRAIAAGAKVDPALVHHYFGTKDQLFVETVQMPVNPADLIPQIAAGGRDEIGERLARVFLTVWDSPAGVAGVALVRSAVNSEWSARLLREFVITQILRRVLRLLDIEHESDAQLRGTLVASQLIGMAIARYVVKVEPLASIPREALAKAVGPTLQRYFLGDLDSTGLKPTNANATNISSTDASSTNADPTDANSTDAEATDIDIDSTEADSADGDHPADVQRVCSSQEE